MPIIIEAIQALIIHLWVYSNSEFFAPSKLSLKKLCTSDQMKFYQHQIDEEYILVEDFYSLWNYLSLFNIVNRLLSLKNISWINFIKLGIFTSIKLYVDRDSIPDIALCRLKSRVWWYNAQARRSPGSTLTYIKYTFIYVYISYNLPISQPWLSFQWGTVYT